MHDEKVAQPAPAPDGVGDAKWWPTMGERCEYTYPGEKRGFSIIVIDPYPDEMGMIQTRREDDGMIGMVYPSSLKPSTPTPSVEGEDAVHPEPFRIEGRDDVSYVYRVSEMNAYILSLYKKLASSAAALPANPPASLTRGETIEHLRAQLTEAQAEIRSWDILCAGLHEEIAKLKKAVKK